MTEEQPPKLSCNSAKDPSLATAKLTLDYQICCITVLCPLKSKLSCKFSFTRLAYTTQGSITKLTLTGKKTQGSITKLTLTGKKTQGSITKLTLTGKNAF